MPVYVLDGNAFFSHPKPLLVKKGRVTRKADREPDRKMAIALSISLVAVITSPKMIEGFIVHYFYSFIISEHIKLVNNTEIH